MRIVERLGTIVLALAVMGGTASAQDATAVVQAAITTLGGANLKSIRYSGTGYVGEVGQSFSPELEWPLLELSSYTRTIDYQARSSREDLVLKQGNNEPLGGGRTPIQGELRQALLVSGDYAWNLQGNNPVPAPAALELRQLDILRTPHGFLRAALEAAKAGNATAVTRYEFRQKMTVVSFVAMGKYRLNGTINANNLLVRVLTWIPNPVRGDLHYEVRYGDYKDFGGLKFPTEFHQHTDLDDSDFLPNISGGHDSFGIIVTDVKADVPDAPLVVPDVVRKATVPPVVVVSQKLADGVWMLGGGTHNSVAVEFRDFVAVIEAPLNEQRSIAVITEVYKLIPNKQIRYIVSTHHHWDHIGGLRTYVHEGATIITHRRNRPFYEEILGDRRRILEPDRLSLHPPREVLEDAYLFENLEEKYVLTDSVRTLEIHRIDHANHVEGMVVAYLPKEQILVEADLYNPPAAGAQPPGTPSQNNLALYNNLRNRKIEASLIVPIHGRPVPMADFLKEIGKSQ